MLWKFSKVYNPERQKADHRRPVRYEMRLPETVPQKALQAASLYVHHPEVLSSKVTS
jgi:hypothetical protein